MPDWTSIDAFRRELDKVDERIAREDAARITREAAESALPEGYKVAAQHLGGDPKFSGWAPWLELVVARERGGTGHRIQPTKVSAGPWTVADIGRNRGDAGGFAGPGVNRKTGETARTKTGKLRKVRAFKAKRWNGITYGWGVAGKAAERFDAVGSGVMAKGLTKALRRHFDVT